MLSFITKQRLGIGLLTLMLAFLPASAAGPDGRRHNLYMVSVGQTYTDKGQKLTKLPCCEKDAIDMFRWAESQKGKLFDQVHARKMVDGEAKSKPVVSTSTSAVLLSKSIKNEWQEIIRDAGPCV